jgi:hypothetical protein
MNTISPHKVQNKTITVLKEKASKSDCTYKVSAIAFDKKGNILGHARNTHSKWDVLEKCNVGRAGTAEHAERVLMRRYGSNIKTILISRVGHSGILRPISPCKTCQKVADKLGIKIISVEGVKENER